MLNPLQVTSFSTISSRLWSRLKQSSIKTFTLLFAMGLCLSLAVSACSGTDRANSAANSSASDSSQAKSSNVIRIGYQKYGTLSILKARGALEESLKAQGVSVQWTQFPAGPQLLEALNAGSLDFGHTGEAPPIFAQAAGAPLVYVAHEASAPKSEAIIVLNNSPIRDVAGLKGKKVALNKGSNVHYLLVQALAANGLKYSDIKPVYLPPADARAAFQSGSIDAWVIWDPYFATAQQSAGARILKNGEGLVANREFYLASQTFAKQYPDRIKAILTAAQKVDGWAATKPTEVAKLLSPQLGLDVPTLELAAKRRPYGVQQMTSEVIAYQQKLADTFYQLGLIPKQLNVSEVAQLPKQ